MIRSFVAGLVIFVCGLFCLDPPARGYWQSIQQVGVGGSAYVGPGDVVSGAFVWWGFRGYNAAYSGNAANICTPLDALCLDVTIVGGALNTTTLGTLACNNTTTICTVKTLYDQSGTTRNATQATIANRPSYIAPGASNGCSTASLPCMKFTNASTQTLTTTATLTLSQPITFSMVANRTNNNGGYFSAGPIFVDGNTSSNILANAGTTLAGVTTLNAFHATQIILNGASSQMYIDGVLTPASPANGGTNGLASQSIILGTDTFTALSGFVSEFGMWGSAFTGGNSGLDSNQRTYWGF